MGTDEQVADVARDAPWLVDLSRIGCQYRIGYVVELLLKVHQVDRILYAAIQCTELFPGYLQIS